MCWLAAAAGAGAAAGCREDGGARAHTLKNAAAAGRRRCCVTGIHPLVDYVLVAYAGVWQAGCKGCLQALPVRRCCKPACGASAGVPHCVGNCRWSSHVSTLGTTSYAYLISGFLRESPSRVRALRGPYRAVRARNLNACAIAVCWPSTLLPRRPGSAAPSPQQYCTTGQYWCWHAAHTVSWQLQQQGYSSTAAQQTKPAEAPLAAL
jgi:hypothetical protein